MEPATTEAAESAATQIASSLPADPVTILVIAAAIAFTAACIAGIIVLRRTGIAVYSAGALAIRDALDLLQLKDGDRFCDLGCGSGKVLRSARRRAKITATGYELNPFAIIYLWALGITDIHTHIRCRDFRNADLSEFNAVYLYLLPGGLPTLALQLENQLSPGTRVVSVDFPIPGWKEVETRSHGQQVWLYIIGQHQFALDDSSSPEGGAQRGVDSPSAATPPAQAVHNTPPMSEGSEAPLTPTSEAPSSPEVPTQTHRSDDV